MNLLDLARSAVPDKTLGPARRWPVRYPDAAPMEVLFTPAQTHAEVAKEYPGASIDLLPDPVLRYATVSEAAELRELVALVLANADDADREEALTVALRDPEAALRSFRALADVLNPSLNNDEA